MHKVIKKIPILRSIVRISKEISSGTFFSKFEDSESYWVQRYNTGGNSGPGSYNELAQFKADILNTFVSENNVNSVIEFGSGDGNQLTLADYPEYLGLDVSDKAIELCRTKFSGDTAKQFKLVSEYSGETAELALSLDVIYHLVEDETFYLYMNNLFGSSSRFVIIYSSNHADNSGHDFAHVRHRLFTEWIKINKPEWKLLKEIPNKFRFVENARRGSFADFYIYELSKDG